MKRRISTSTRYVLFWILTVFTWIISSSDRVWWLIVTPIILLGILWVFNNVQESESTDTARRLHMDCNYVYDGKSLKFTALKTPLFPKILGSNAEGIDLAYVAFRTKEKMSGAVIPSLVGDTDIKTVHTASDFLFEKNFSLEHIEPDIVYEVTCTGYAVDSKNNYSQRFGTGGFSFSAELGSAMSTEGEVSEPTINLHAERTSVRLGGELIKLNLSVVHTILTEHELTTNLIFTVPSGWSLEFEGTPGVASSQACSGGQCNAVYRLQPGQQRAIVVLIRPNQEGDFIVSARVELRYGENSDIQTHRIPVSVTK